MDSPGNVIPAGTISKDGTKEWDGQAWQRHLSFDGTTSFDGNTFVPLAYPLTPDEARMVAARIQRNEQARKVRRRNETAKKVAIGFLWILFLIGFVLFWDPNHYP